MKDWLSIKLGRTIQAIGKFYGGGSALPGLVLEKINSNLVADSLQELPYGVVVVSGTNGKTTTTKALVTILEAQGLKVFTNKTGSNFMRGVASAWLANVDRKGHLSADIAVLELDEAHAIQFTNQILPSYCLLLNILRDQLDRFGEIDNVAALLSKIAHSTTKTVILNANDGRLVNLGQYLKQHSTQTTKPARHQAHKTTSKPSALTPQVRYFGLIPDLARQLINPDQIKPRYQPKPQVFLKAFQNNKATLITQDQQLQFKSPLDGLHNQLNLAGAVTTAQAILGDHLDYKQLVTSLEQISPAFGRGESFKINNRWVKLILVKNPAGFQASLATLSQKTPALIALNDNYADGRDVSWIWDVDFTATKFQAVYATGSRSADMALRLKYDEIKADHQPHIQSSLHDFLKDYKSDVVIFATYTAMLKLRHELLRLTKKQTTT